ncbi:MAG: hypothetical protein ACREQ9_10290 [Candidatus Binatia bacterium]
MSRPIFPTEPSWIWSLTTSDELDQREREALNAAISRSLEQSAAGRAAPVEEILAKLQARRGG